MTDEKWSRLLSARPTQDDLLSLAKSLGLPEPKMPPKASASAAQKPRRPQAARLPLCIEPPRTYSIEVVGLKTVSELRNEIERFSKSYSSSPWAKEVLRYIRSVCIVLFRHGQFNGKAEELGREVFGLTREVVQMASADYIHANSLLQIEFQDPPNGCVSFATALRSLRIYAVSIHVFYRGHTAKHHFHSDSCMHHLFFYLSAIINSENIKVEWLQGANRTQHGASGYDSLASERGIMLERGDSTTHKTFSQVFGECMRPEILVRYIL